MTQAEMENNARLTWAQLQGYGWTLNATAGVLGNWQYESYINPGQWQIGYPIGGDHGGFGLGQWTPPSHYVDWANLNGYDQNDGMRQVEYLHLNNIYYNGTYHGSQWNPNPAPGWTWEEYKSSTASAGDCANAFFRQWEQAEDMTVVTRMRYAQEWFEYLGGITPPTPGGTKKMPIYMYLKRL